jgi:hypothetical protein
MEATDQIEAPQLVSIGTIAILEEIGDQLDGAALSDGTVGGCARTCDAMTLTDRMYMGVLLAD